MYSPADLLSGFLVGAVAGAVGLLLILAHIGKKAKR